MKLSILETKTDRVDKLVIQFSNLKSLKLSQIEVKLDYKLILTQIKTLTSLSLWFN